MPLTAQERIILIRIKVERAKKHLRDLATEILALEHTNITIRKLHSEVLPHPITFRHEPRDLTRVPRLSFESVCIAGDVIHNLRAALDHLAHQLVLVGCPGTIPTRRIEFPIAESLTKYEADKARKVQGMRSEAVDAIDRLKPYKGGNDALWRIHALDNIDKHRAVFTIDHDVLFTGDWLPDDFLLRAQDPDFAGIESKVEQNIQSEIEKAVNQAQIGQNGALLPTLHQLVDFVDNLIPAFEPLLK